MLDLGLYDGAYYMAGYAVECALKACIAKETRRHQFPDKKRVDSSHSHDLMQLIKVARLEDEHRERIRNDKDFKANWGVAVLCSEQSRYQRHNPDSARAMVLAVSKRHNGVIAWIKLH